ncbi:hypothetical protein FGW37_27855 [Streptomyces rectiverticillatus]|nr:hypothetical protein FGW37_27855 [Streptomyces rectiverticillatus]
MLTEAVEGRAGLVRLTNNVLVVVDHAERHVLRQTGKGGRRSHHGKADARRTGGPVPDARLFALALPFPGESADADAGAGGTDWRALLRTYAVSLRQALLRHPGVLPLAASRPAVTPATLDAVERGLTTLTASGFPLGAAVHALTVYSREWHHDFPSQTPSYPLITE